MYFESNGNHKKGEKKKKRLGDWAKAFKHTVPQVLDDNNLIFDRAVRSNTKYSRK